MDFDNIGQMGSGVAQFVANANQGQAQYQANQASASELWKAKTLASILSAYRKPNGDLDSVAARKAAEQSNLVPEYRAAVLGTEQSEMAKRAEIAQNRFLLEQMGAPSQVGVYIPPRGGQIPAKPSQEVDATGFTTPDMAQPGQTTAATAPNGMTSGEVNVTASLPAMPAPEYMTQLPEERDNIAEALDYKPKSVSEMMGDTGASVAPRAMSIEQGAKRDPRYLATLKDWGERTGLAPAGSTPEQAEAALAKHFETKLDEINSKVAIPMAYRTKDDPSGMSGFIKAKTQANAEAAGLLAQFQTMFESKGTEYSDQAQKAQASGIALSGAQNAATEKNAERSAIGGVIQNANDKTGLNLDPSKFKDQKEATEMAGRVITATRAINLLSQPGFLTGDWNKKLTEMNAIKGAMQQIDKIPATDAGEHILVNMLFPDMSTADMVRLGLIGENGGMTSAGVKWLSTQATNIPAATIRENVKNMISHSTILQADIDKYRAGKDGPQNYGFQTPDAVANPFRAEPTPTAMPTAAEIRKMKPAEARKELAKKYDERRKAGAKAPAATKPKYSVGAGGAGWEKIPNGSEYTGPDGKKYTKGVGGK